MLHKGRRTFAVVMIVFVLPVILAKLALEFDFFNQGATNQGQLITPPLSLEGIDLPETVQQKWLIVYSQIGECNARCENAKYSLQQVHLALGRNMERAEPLLLSTQDSISDFPEQNLLTLSEENINQVFKGQSIDGIFIADPMGNIMLRFELEDDKQAMVMRSREILSDLKKLLKLSRIG